MSDFDNKLSAILGDQNAMSQIMALAQSLSGAQGQAPEDCSEPSGPTEFPAQPGQDVQLLAALRPYLKQRRQKKLDRTLELLQLLRLLKSGRE